MNVRSQILELTMEGRQINEALASIFHTLLFHRSFGKFLYSNEISYSIGTVRTWNIHCDFIDSSYACCASATLDRAIMKEINSFSEQLRSQQSGTGQISLEFFQKKRNRYFWPSTCEAIPWEVWTVQLDLLEMNTEDERQLWRERVGDMLTDKLLDITEYMNRHEYVPQIPPRSELDLIFDTSHPDVQPYLFKFKTSTELATTSVKSTLQKIIKETMSL